MTYGELKTAIQNSLEYDETSFVAQLPFIIARAEQRIYRDVSIPDGITTTSASMTTSNREITLPSGFLEPRSLVVTNASSRRFPLLFKDASFIDEAWPTGTTTTAFPQFYAIDDDGILYVAPTPDSTYAYELRWYGVGATIVDAGNDANTSWLGDNAEGCLLYSCLYEGYLYMKGNPELLAEYKAEYDKEATALKLQLEGRATHDAFEGGIPRISR